MAAGAAASALFTPEGLAWPKVGRGAAAVALAFLLALVYGAVLPRDPGGG